MPQKFQILRCFSCETFNVDILKKNNLKWQCKMCGENQSIKNVYGTSDTAKGQLMSKCPFGVFKSKVGD